MRSTEDAKWVTSPRGGVSFGPPAVVFSIFASGKEHASIPEHQQGPRYGQGGEPGESRVSW